MANYGMTAIKVARYTLKEKDRSKAKKKKSRKRRYHNEAKTLPPTSTPFEEVFG